MSCCCGLSSDTSAALFSQFRLRWPVDKNVNMTHDDKVTR